MNDGTVKAGIHDQDRFANMNKPLDPNGRDYMFSMFKEGIENQPKGFRVNSMPAWKAFPLDTAAKFNAKAFEAYRYWNYVEGKGFTAGKLDLNTIKTMFPELPDSLPKDWPKGNVTPGGQSLLLFEPNVVPFRGRDGLPVWPGGRRFAFQTARESPQLAMAA